MRNSTNVGRYEQSLRSVSQWFAALAPDIGSVLFPPVCSYCDRDLPSECGGARFCDDCLPKLYEPPTHRCPKCAAQVAVTFQGPDCPWCREHDLRFDYAYALGRYADDLREAVLRLKHVGEESLATGLARLLVERHASAWEAAEIDVVVPIPMHWWRRAWQGHNGPDLTAALIAQRLKVYDYPRLLCRRRRTRPQAGLSRPERRENVRGCFSLRRGYRIDGAKVLLVDDILTTGATCSEAARTLKRAGAASVSVAVLGRAQGEV